jgi:hypothetical protein
MRMDDIKLLYSPRKYNELYKLTCEFDNGYTTNETNEREMVKMNQFVDCEKLSCSVIFK